MIFSIITFLDHQGLTRTFPVCLCLSFPCTHQTEYAGHFLWNVKPSGVLPWSLCLPELSPAKKLQVQRGNLVSLRERGRATYHPPNPSLPLNTHTPNPPQTSVPVEAESCLYPYSYPSLFMKPCAPHQANRGERAGVLDSSTGANLIPLSQPPCWHLPRRRCYHSPALLIVQNPCSHESTQEDHCLQLSHTAFTFQWEGHPTIFLSRGSYD